MSDQEFERPGAGERFRQLGYLLKNTVTIVGRDRDIIAPWIRTVVYASVMICAFFGGVVAYALDAGGISTLLFLAAFAMFVYKHFYYTRQDMAQSWLVAETVRGRDAVPGAGLDRVSGLGSQARGLGWAALAFAYVTSRSQNDGDNSGIAGTLMRLVLAGLSEVWDLARHFLIPAVTVDEFSLRDGLEQMKGLRNSVPEALVGVFGIDIAGGSAGMLMAPVYLILILAALGAGLVVGDAAPAFYLGDLRAVLANDVPLPGAGPLHFSWLPLLVVLWLGKMLGAAFARVVGSVKLIYFTLFYLRISHAEDIVPELRKELEGYLRLRERDESAGGLADDGAPA